MNGSARIALENFDADFAIRRVGKAQTALLNVCRWTPRWKAMKFRRWIRWRGRTRALRDRIAAKWRRANSFLRRHFRKTIEPQALNTKGRGSRVEGRTQGIGCRVEQSVSVLQFVFRRASLCRPRTGARDREVWPEVHGANQGGRTAPKPGWRELMLLQFAEQLAELLGETGAARAVRNNFNSLSCRINRARSTITRPSSASNPAGIGRRAHRGRTARALERKCSVACILAGRCRRALAFELERGLLGRKQNQRRPSGDLCSAWRISARQRNVLPLPAGPRRKCACTDFFSPKDAKSQGIYLQFWQRVVGRGPRFLFPSEKLALL